MPTPDSDASDVLCREVLADARRESDEIIRRARQQAEALLAKADTEADQARWRRLEQARGEAARRRDAILAGVAVDVGRMRSARTESLLQSLYRQIRDRLAMRDAFDRGEALVGLAAEAVRQMEGDTFVIRWAAGAEPSADEICRRSGRGGLKLTIAEDPAISGGVIVQQAGGRQLWDNRLGARLDRMWPELRRRIAAHLRRDT